MPFLNVGQVAEQLGVAPKLLTDLLYRRREHAKQCQLVNGRRMIPADYVRTLAAELRRAGKLPASK